MSNLMIKELYIKVIISLLFLVSCIRVEDRMEPKEYGEMSNLFSYIINESWKKNEDFKRNHDPAEIEKFILIEYGSVNFKNYDFILYDLSSNKIIFKDNGVTTIKKILDIDKINNYISNLTTENNIFDGTAMIKDGKIYILTYFDKFERYKLGSYCLVLGEQYPDKRIENIAKFNIDLIKIIIDEKQIYIQNKGENTFE